MVTFSLIVFSLSIGVLTLTQHAVLSMYVFGVVIVLSIIAYRKDRYTYLGLALGSMVLAFVCVQFFIYRYNNSTINPAKDIVQYNDGGYAYLVQTGTIKEQQTHNRYIWQSDSGVPFFLYSEKTYAPGDTIRLVASAQLTYQTGLSLFVGYGAKRERIQGLVHAYTFDFSNRQVMKGVAGSLYEQNSIFIGRSSIGGIVGMKKFLQDKIQETFIGLDRVRGLIAGMLIGDRSMMTEDDYKLFIDSGIVHIIAVSGGNIVMLVLFLQLILFWVPFYARIVIILPCVILYALLCGLDASVLRAVIMGGLSLVALFVGKQTTAWRSLAVAYIAMLCINPFFLVYDIGFIFSFAAVIGIVYMTQWTQHIASKQKYIHRVLHDYVFPSLGASMAIVPFLLFFTGVFNSTSVVANILVVPVVPIVMLLGLGSMLFQGSFIGDGLVDATDRLIDYVYAVATLTQKYGIYIMSKGYWFMYLLLFIVICAFIIDRIRSNKINV